MSPDLVAAVSRARAAAGFYVVCWGAFAAVVVAMMIGAAVFPAVLTEQGRRDAGDAVAVVCLLGIALPFVGDAVLTLCLTALPRAAGGAPMHPASRALLVVVALCLPLIATAASTSIAARALPPDARAEALPASRWTLWYPLAIFFAFGCTAPLVGLVVAHPAATGLAMLLAYPAVAVVRVVLGLQLRSQFEDRLQRRAVDDDHARGVAPVAGG